MSTLTIELDTVTEQNLSQISAKEGTAIEQVAAPLLANAVHPDKRLTPQEIQLMRLAREELSDAHWKRYRKLSRKRRAVALAPELPENLALSCQQCNNQKFVSTEAMDPLTQEMAPLYDPRQHRWTEYFG